jgi:hypothetical protein
MPPGIRLTPDDRNVDGRSTLWDRQRTDLDAAVVMPDHVHMLFRMRSGASRSGEMHGIKGFSAREINRLTGHRGAIWMDESFDHIVRNENEWEQKIEYVRVRLRGGWRKCPLTTSGSGWLRRFQKPGSQAKSLCAT